MIKSIFQKEFIKLKYYIIVAIIIFPILFFLFFYNLNHEFKGIEPESMMWYRYIYLNYYPEYSLKFIPIVFGIILAIAQFLPEKIGKRVKILLHLPLNTNKALFLHISFTIAFLTLFFILFGSVFYTIINQFYPTPIVINSLGNFTKFCMAAIFIYVGLSSAILEQKLMVSFLKGIISFIVLYLILNLHIAYSIFFTILFYFISLDSLKSFKEQRINKQFICFTSLFLAIFIIFFGYKIYIENFKRSFQKYYIFYSPIIEKFVYQKNHGGHIFSYLTEDKKDLSQKEYEALLPFNYWANLKQQNKMPIVLNGKNYSEKDIKASRLSLDYKYKELNENHMNLYPLFNPKKDVSVISYSEDMIWVKKDKFVVFHHDSKIDDDLSNKLNLIAKEKGLSFPIKKIWGKFSNLKPFDAGLFIKDSKNEIYNLARYDDKITLKKLPIKQDITHIKISENKQNDILGFAFDDKNIYLLKSKDYKLVNLNLKEFDYKSMNLKLLKDPLFYQIRFDNGKTYSSNVYDNNLNFIRKFEINYE
ncbi:putative membrane protein [Campylobacter blaseri]|uniref:DUF4857 domain-containing protein n=1 Tax=Campylobacter blaseri TaxID=2042961 RepID=A0A2P8QYY8_9BACT|nr:DUF4857 domain-containing protein [Campylobacter blaseri]PSM51470.1 hypothetical protein CQ405_07840 [Campylobacter blaseri]PSM52919.1 hypothetical protein CRN67_07845 [Campylobacter blaseri]QKF86524.1 putative membrane protein [Campylobacter blaseri]